MSAFMTITVFAAGNSLSYSFTGSDADWPGLAMTYVGKNEYQKSIYKYVITNPKRSHIIFSDSNNSNTKTDTIVASDYMAYYIDSSSKVVSYKFKDSYITSTG